MKKVITLSQVNLANTYIIKSNEESVIIDPSSRLNKIKSAVGSAKVIAILLTHGHYDHFHTLLEVLNHYNAPVYLHHEAYKKLGEPRISYGFFFGDEANHQFEKSLAHFVCDNEEIELSSSFQLKVFGTPGHTNCSVCFLIDGNLFTGDTLFSRNVGRSDLATGNELQLIQSVKRILRIPENYVVYPGHDNLTTIEEERENNPFYLSNL